MTVRSEYVDAQQGCWDHFVLGSGRETPGISRHLMSATMLDALMEENDRMQLEIMRLRVERDTLSEQLSLLMSSDKKVEEGVEDFLNGFAVAKHA